MKINEHSSPIARPILRGRRRLNQKPKLHRQTHTHTHAHAHRYRRSCHLVNYVTGGEGDTGERHRNGHGGRLWKFTTLLRLVAPIAGHTEIE